jgi:hypothetical protein
MTIRLYVKPKTKAYDVAADCLVVFQAVIGVETLDY